MGDDVIDSQRHPTVWTITATCDRCGKVETWEGNNDPNDSGELALRGYQMADPVPTFGRWLWFCSSVCVHAYIDDKVILAHQREVAAA